MTKRTIKEALADYNKATGKKLKAWRGSLANLEEKINEARAGRPGRKPTEFTATVRAKGLDPRSVRAKLRKAGLHGPYELKNAKVRAVINA